MKVTYIYHSSFAVELEKSMLIFDYYGKGDLPERPAGKQVYFLNSHSNPDHFSKTIFNLREQFGGAEYVLAREIRLKPEEKKEPAPKSELKPARKHAEKAEVKAEIKTELKTEPKPALQAEQKAEEKPEPKQEAKPKTEKKQPARQKNAQKRPNGEKPRREKTAAKPEGHNLEQLPRLIAPYPQLQENTLKELILANKRQVLCNTLRKQLGQEKGLALYNELKKSVWK